MKRENFYRRDPSKALSGMVGLSLEERGVYNTVLDLLYSNWRPLEDNRAFIAGWCGCAVQKINPIIRRLIESERLITFIEGGRTYISDEAFEVERKAVKGASKTRSGRGEVGEKSGEVGQKSDGVEENHALLDDDVEENQQDTALDKRRVEENREANASSVVSTTAKTRKRTEYPIGFEEAWVAYPHTDGRSSKPNSLDQWRKLSDEERIGLVSAIAAFRPNVAKVCGDRGAPCMSRWLKDGKHLNWMSRATDATETPMARFAGPEELRSRVLALTDQDFVVAYIDPSGWDGTKRAIVARTSYGANQIRNRLGGYLAEKKITVSVAAPAPPKAVAQTQKECAA